MSVNVKNTKISEIKPRQDDVLLQHIPKIQSDLIYIEEDASKDDVQHFRVCAIGSNVSCVSVGDRVLASWTRVTEPFKVIGNDGKLTQVGITSQKELLAVLEE